MKSKEQLRQDAKKVRSASSDVVLRQRLQTVLYGIIDALGRFNGGDTYFIPGGGGGGSASGITVDTLNEILLDYLKKSEYSSSLKDILNDYVTQVFLNEKLEGFANKEELSQILKDLVESIFSTADQNYLSKKKDDKAEGRITFGKGADFGRFVAGLLTGQGGNIDERGNAELQSLGLRGAVTFRGANQGTSGAGIWEDEYGWHIQTDYLTVFNKAEFTEIEIQKVSHVGGQFLLTAASCTASKVERVGADYRVYFAAEGDNGEAVVNKWEVNDIAYCETFNLTKQADGKTGNHYYKYVVKDKGMSADGKMHYITLNGNYKDAYSDEPFIEDAIVQLGNVDDSQYSRQGAILIEGAGANAPCILEFSKINSFRLPAPDTQIKPNDNIFTGKFILKPDSTFEDGKNLKDAVDKVDNLEYGKNNLLRNTSFNGDASTINTEGHLNGDTQTYSPSLEHWDFTSAVAQTSTVAKSGKEVVISNGNLSQVLAYPINANSDVIFSFKGKGSSLTFNVGGYAETVTLDGTYKRYVCKFKSKSKGTIFSITNANCTLCEMQLEEGTVVSSWGESNLDIPNTYLNVENLRLQYLKDALQGSTTVNGGLVLSNLIMLGLEKGDNGEKTVTAGVNGLRWDENSVAHWGGGTFEQAIYTVAKYLNDPRLQPTQEELANMAMFVVTHGGRAILNDIIARGTIYATDGVFNGTVYATDGEFSGIVNARGGTFANEGGDNKISIANGLIQFFGKQAFPNITLGIDENGCSVLKFYDKDGNFKYNLGPEGIIKELSHVDSSFTGLRVMGIFSYATSLYSSGVFSMLQIVDAKSVYKFNEGYTRVGGVVKYEISQTETPSEWNGKVYDSNEYISSSNTAPKGNKIPSGYYVTKEFPYWHPTIEMYQRELYYVETQGAIPVLVGNYYYIKTRVGKTYNPCDVNGNEYEHIVLQGKTLVEIAQMNP